MSVNGKPIDGTTEGIDAKSGRVRSGQARMERLTPEERTALAKKAASSRWKTDGAPLLRATHEGPLKIGDIEIQCAVLEDGTRVLSRAGFIRAIGRSGKAKGGRKYDLEFKVPVFLSAANLKPFITEELLVNSTPIAYRPLKGGPAIGYRAELLPGVCHIFQDARDAHSLLPIQMHIAERCKIISRGFGVVGIAALVDEATGYQYERSREALQAILDAYLRKEFASWAKRFPDEFYEQMFRLRNWDWRGRRVNPPSVVGHYTNDLVYERLAPGIVEELKRINPKDENGRRKAKHHQWLTQDIGHPALSQHMYGLLGLMRACSDWDQFYLLLQDAYPKKNSQMLLPGAIPDLSTSSQRPS